MEQIEVSNRLYRLVALLAIVGAIVILGSLFVKFAALPGNEPKYLTVSGEGKVYVSPNIALASFGITKNGTDISKLTTEVNTAMNSIVSGLKNLGINEKDIQTTQYNINPRYNYNYKTGERILDGYDMTQSLSVKIRDFSKIGEAFNVATTNGANLVNDLSFTIDDQEQFNQQARIKAFEQAKQKAQNMAKASGLWLGKLIDISEGGTPYYSYTKSINGMGGAEDARVPAPEIQPGQQEVNITVSLTYRIQ